MSVDGRWRIEISGWPIPPGWVQAVLTLETTGNTLTGTMNSEDLGSATLFDGTVDGNQLAWKANVVQPPPASVFEFKGTFDSTSMEGTVKMWGMDDEHYFSGLRV